MRRVPAASAAILYPLVPLLLLAQGCGDPLGLRATEEVQSSSFHLFSFSHVPPSYASALDSPLLRAAFVDPGGSFDVAFDLTEDGQIRVMPVRTLVTPLIGANSIGLQTVPGTFETVDRAPAAGYVRDSVMTVSPGQVVVMEAQRTRGADFCTFAFSQHIYSKFVVDLIDQELHTVTLRITVNPNCGFRSFAEGIPRD